MRLSLPPLALLDPSRVATSEPDYAPASQAVRARPDSRKRLKVLLSIFWALLLLNAGKFLLIGSLLGCG